jgi:Fur family ferric uptake transcriptional regulator
LSALSRIERLCQKKGLKMTGQRRVIARVLSESDDHPDVEAVHRRATRADPKISIATVYRTVRLFEEASILERHDFGDGRARYEEAADDHHDHLIDIESGEVIEFHNEDIEELQEQVARKLGFRLVDHRLELYGVRLGRGKTDNGSEQ